MKKNQYANEYLFAFTQTVPILLGYIFLGIAFGLMLQDAGYNFIWAFFMSIFVYVECQYWIDRQVAQVLPEADAGFVPYARRDVDI